MHSLTEAQTRLISQTVVIEDLQAKVSEYSSSKADLQAKLLELSTTQASAVQKASAETYKNCEEGFKRELAQKGVSVVLIRAAEVGAKLIISTSERIEASQ